MMAAGSNSGQGSNLGRWRTLCVLVAAVSLMVIDGTIVNVALPTMIDSVLSPSTRRSGSPPFTPWYLRRSS